MVLNVFVIIYMYDLVWEEDNLWKFNILFLDFSSFLFVLFSIFLFFSYVIFKGVFLFVWYLSFMGEFWVYLEEWFEGFLNFGGWLIVKKFDKLKVV